MMIRPALRSDAAAMLAIYAPVVRETAISFETEVPTLAEFETRIEKYSQGWAWLVAEQGGTICGYAYGGVHREQPAYRWSTETTVYVADTCRRQGIGRQLYQALLSALAERGYCNAYAAVALPNPASVAVHQAVGFIPIDTFPAVGRKFGRWHDVGWFYCPLRSLPPDQKPISDP